MSVDPYQPPLAEAGERDQARAAPSTASTVERRMMKIAAVFAIVAGLFWMWIPAEALLDLVGSPRVLASYQRSNMWPGFVAGMTITLAFAGALLVSGVLLFRGRERAAGWLLIVHVLCALVTLYTLDQNVTRWLNSVMRGRQVLHLFGFVFAYLVFRTAQKRSRPVAESPVPETAAPVERSVTRVTRVKRPRTRRTSSADE